MWSSISNTIEHNMELHLKRLELHYSATIDQLPPGNASLNSACIVHSGHHQPYAPISISTEAASDSGQFQSISPLSKLMLDHLLKPAQALDQTLDYYFADMWHRGEDQRTSQLPFMSGGPWKLVYATLVYLYLIKLLLPTLMRPHRPLELNWPIRAYNLMMVLSNMYAFYHGARILQFGYKCFGCEVINHQDYSPEAVELLHYGWLFLVSRLVEWLDTIFFVLRKRHRQVTKLHVFHHSFVPLLCWVYLKYHPGYTMAFFPLVNTFVHTIMYTYYFLATFGPSLQPYLWWKKYLTSMQIIQFVLILIQLASIPMGANDKCQAPGGFLYVAFAGAMLFLWLFYTYYLDTYQNANKPSNKQTATKNNNKGLSSCGAQNNREGSSKSLSDAIDNAIATTTGLNHFDTKIKQR